MSSDPMVTDRSPSAVQGRRDRAWIAAVAAVVLALGLPYALRGPRLLHDDWWVLRNVAFHTSVVDIGGRAQLAARPGAWLIYTVVFSVVGAHPLVLYLVQLLGNITVAVLLFRVFRRFVVAPVAAAVPTVWATMGNHATLDHWASTLQAVACLTLLLVGVLGLLRGVDADRMPWGALATLVASALCYEASVPIGLVAVVGIPLVLGPRRPRHDIAAVGGAAIGLAAIWMALHSQRHVPHGWADLSVVPVAQFGRGIVNWSTPAQVSLALALCGVVVAVARLALPGFRGTTGVGERLAVAGVATMALGSAAFLKFPLQVIGINDRANVVTSVGGAMCWVALGVLLARWRAVLVVAAVGFAALVIPTRLSRDVDYVRAGRSGDQLLHRLDVAFPVAPAAVVIGPSPSIFRGVVDLESDWDTTAAWQFHRRNSHITARITADDHEFRVAPPPKLDLRTGRVEATPGATPSRHSP